MNKTAQQLAAQGRHGDTELLHVSKQELAALRGLGSLHGVRMTTNPNTGLPEAFNFTKLIPAVVGIGATVLSGGTLSPLAAGLISGAATTAVTGDVKQGLISGITGGAAAGLGQGIAAMGGAGAAGASGAAAGELGSGMAQTGIGSLGSEAAIQGAAAPALESTAGTAAGANFGELGSGMSGVGAEAAAPTIATSSAAAPAATSGFDANTFAQNAQDGSQWNAQFGGDKFATRTAPGLLATTNSVAGAMAPEPWKMSEADKERDRKSGEFAGPEKFMQRDVSMPGERNGPPSSEFEYFTKPRYNFDNNGFAQGGITSLPAGAQDSGTMKAVRAIRSRYRSKKAAIEDMQLPGSFISKLGIQDPNDPIMQYAFGYTATQGKKKAPTDRMSTPLDRMQAPQYAAGGLTAGPGDGMSDSIPATINGRQPAALGDGEFVVPADVVSHLGNGSTKAGASELQQMMARIRSARTGRPEQAPAVNPKRVLPR